MALYMDGWQQRRRPNRLEPKFVYEPKQTNLWLPLLVPSNAKSHDQSPRSR
jgi:hypothetical protein